MNYENFSFITIVYLFKSVLILTCRYPEYSGPEEYF